MQVAGLVFWLAQVCVVFGSCPSDFPETVTLPGGKTECLYLDSGWHTYCAAAESCWQRNGKLVEGNDLLRAAIAQISNQKRNNKYIGAMDIVKEGLWKWNSGEIANLDGLWLPGEPNSIWEDCAHFWRDGSGLNDVTCTNKYQGYICMQLPPRSKVTKLSFVPKTREGNYRNTIPKGACAKELVSKPYTRENCIAQCHTRWQKSRCLAADYKEDGGRCILMFHHKIARLDASWERYVVIEP